MKERKYTEGPWVLEEPVPGDKDIVIEAKGDGWNRLFCSVTRDDCDTEAALANARLIAAAPELFEACGLAVDILKTLDPIIGAEKVALRECMSALAKASNERGER